ncbi:MAG TPA: DUF2911 domain-containing protein [Candidatus Polarisedimenticolaceae bacterium]|nr:DUF2911 domain-containing protein [Candidatus Polarisedimenticolaceae bacterium]
MVRFVRAAVLVVAAALPAFAQGLEVPAPSSKARVEQRVGLTDFSVDYSSPAARGRKIFGGLLPYDKLWRTGANASTKLTASRDFTFGGKPVPKGTYAILSMPGASGWTVILNKNLEIANTDGYDTKDDVARVEVKPESIPARERMTFLFSDSTDGATRLDLEWETTRVSVPITVDTAAQVKAGIDTTLGDAWRPHYQAGRWLLENNGDVDTAIKYLDTSIGIQSTWWNNWWRAQALAKKGRTADAIAAGERTLELGKGNATFENNFKADVQKTIDGWKKAKA